MISRDNAQPSTPYYIGTLSHRGTLPANATYDVTCSVWITEPAMMSLGGWRLDVETGDEVKGTWIPRKRWSRVVEGGHLDVVHEEG